MFAIRSSFVETLSELDVSVIFLSNGSVTRHLLPSVGSLGLLSLLHWFYEVLRLPNARLALLRLSLGSAVPSLAATETSESPRFLGDLRAHALTENPGGPVLRLTDEDAVAWGVAVSGFRRCLIPSLGHCLSASRRSVVAFHHLEGFGSRDVHISGLDITACSLAVYASQLSFPVSQSYGHARLASSWWSALSGWD